MPYFTTQTKSRKCFIIKILNPICAGGGAKNDTPYQRIANNVKLRGSTTFLWLLVQKLFKIKIFADISIKML